MARKIMFVCMGNICRSPLAEAIFKKKLIEKNLDGKYIADSSGVIGYHEGERADERMRRTAAKHDIEINHLAQKLTEKHLAEFDLILAMDRSNIAEIKSMCKKHDLLRKVMLFRDFDIDKGKGREVPDPYYGGPGGFENVYIIVNRTSENLIKALEQENNE